MDGLGSSPFSGDPRTLTSSLKTTLDQLEEQNLTGDQVKTLTQTAETILKTIGETIDSWKDEELLPEFSKRFSACLEKHSSSLKDSSEIPLLMKRCLTSIWSIEQKRLEITKKELLQSLREKYGTETVQESRGEASIPYDKAILVPDFSTSSIELYFWSPDSEHDKNSFAKYSFAKPPTPESIENRLKLNRILHDLQTNGKVPFVYHDWSYDDITGEKRAQPPGFIYVKQDPNTTLLTLEIYDRATKKTIEVSTSPENLEAELLKMEQLLWDNYAPKENWLDHPPVVSDFGEKGYILTKEKNAEGTLVHLYYLNDQKEIIKATKLFKYGEKTPIIKAKDDFLDQFSEISDIFDINWARQQMPSLDIRFNDLSVNSDSYPVDSVIIDRKSRMFRYPLGNGETKILFANEGIIAACYFAQLQLLKYRLREHFSNDDELFSGSNKFILRVNQYTGFRVAYGYDSIPIKGTTFEEIAANALRIKSEIIQTVMTKLKETFGDTIFKELGSTAEFDKSNYVDIIPSLNENYGITLTMRYLKPNGTIDTKIFDATYNTTLIREGIAKIRFINELERYNTEPTNPFTFIEGYLNTDQYEEGKLYVTMLENYNFDTYVIYKNRLGTGTIEQKLEPSNIQSILTQFKKLQDFKKQINLFKEGRGPQGNIPYQFVLSDDVPKVSGIFYVRPGDAPNFVIEYIEPNHSRTPKIVSYKTHLDKFLETLATAASNYKTAEEVNKWNRFEPSAELRLKTKTSTEVPPLLPQGTPDKLLTLFDRLNFTDRNKPNYVSPSALAEYGQLIAPAKAREYLEKLVRIVTDGKDVTYLGDGPEGHYYGIPDEPDQRELYFNNLRAYLSQIIVLLESPEVDPATSKDVLVSLAIAGDHCGGRWAGEAIEHYNGLIGKAGNTLKEYFLGFSDLLKITIIEKMSTEMEEGEGAELRVRDSHIYLAMCKALSQMAGIGIPAAAGAGYNDPYAHNALQGTKYPDEEAVWRGFMENFNSQAIVNFMHDQSNDLLKAKQSKFIPILVETINDMVREQVENHPKVKAELAPIEAALKERQASILNAREFDPQVLERIISRTLIDTNLAKPVPVTGNEFAQLQAKIHNKFAERRAKALRNIDANDKLTFAEKEAEKRADLKVKSEEYTAEMRNLKQSLLEASSVERRLKIAALVEDRLEEGKYTINDEMTGEPKELTVAGVGALLLFLKFLDPVV